MRLSRRQRRADTAGVRASGAPQSNAALSGASIQRQGSHARKVRVVRWIRSSDELSDELSLPWL